MNKKVLFICKYNEVSGGGSGYSNGYGCFRKFSGLFNSAKFISDQLNRESQVSLVVNARDNNDIDRLVTQYRPDIVIIEALWVVPSKFKVLEKLHPTVKWIIRIHSKMPFLANEGIATKWVAEYLRDTNVLIAPNSEDMTRDLKKVARHLGDRPKGRGFADRIIHLPNYYGLEDDITKPAVVKYEDEVHIGCFGAIRPFKNQLSQAVAAMQFADSTDKRLYFHINSTRVEGRGEPVLKNLRELFDASQVHHLVEHEWLPHPEFKILCATMDFGLQCSFTETFNIVAADFVSVDVPIIVSPQISWMPFWTKAEPTSIRSIVFRLKVVDFLKRVKAETLNKIALETHNLLTINVWLRAFKHL